MIGLAINPQNLDVATEFFELFKVPWEPAVPGKKYRLVLATSDEVKTIDAEVLIFYGSRQCVLDREAGVEVTQLSDLVSIEWKGFSFPVYRGVGVFPSIGQQGVLKILGKSADCRYHRSDALVLRIGYDLFDEIRYLLTKGQPATHALTPTLELHIDLLRHLLIDSGVPFVEIPPRPAGYEFICCLTHDVDFFGIRRHKLDRTMAGFLYRASIGSLIDLLRGRRSLAEAGKNWWACCSLPFVFAGLLPDFWRPFDDYAKVEIGRRSTFFLVPFEGLPGIAPDGTIKSWRATPYAITDVQEEVRRAASRGTEIGLHGIDAWRDKDAGRREMRQVTSLTGKAAAGVRMHWLYFDADAPRRLEQAGFDYDSTCGYNETVGYRAGTSQAFRPLGCATLMELPMCIMDSALFSSGRMGLSFGEALRLSCKIVDASRRFGGTVVINWHERSLAPERLLGKFYSELLAEVEKGSGVWFANASQAVEWFRWRRSISFHQDPFSKAVRVQVSEPRSVHRGVVVRVHRPSESKVEIRDVEFNGAGPMEFQL